jgi:hypothetical protein
VPAHYDIDGFRSRKDIDAVSVLTPSGLHPQHVIACAKAGKHVIVEKPMALRLQDADDMIRAAATRRISSTGSKASAKHGCAMAIVAFTSCCGGMAGPLMPNASIGFTRN